MIFEVISLNLNESIIADKSVLSSVIWEASIDMSEPCPIAIEILDCVRAGASLIPSPIIRTLLPAACKSVMRECFFSGVVWE